MLFLHICIILSNVMSRVRAAGKDLKLEITGELFNLFSYLPCFDHFTFLSLTLILAPSHKVSANQKPLASISSTLLN